MWSYPQLFAHLSTASTGCFSSVFYAFYVECFTYLSTDFCSCAKLTTFARTRLGISCKKVFKRPVKTDEIIDLIPDENGVYQVAYNGSSKELAKIATEIAKGEPVSNGAKRLVYIADNIAAAAAKDAEQKISANIAKRSER